MLYKSTSTLRVSEVPSGKTEISKYKHFTNVDLETLTTEIAKKLNIYCLVIHPVKEVAAVCNGEYFYTFGPFESNPKLTTGAGDNFNAGFCLGQVLGVSPKESLIIGTATSGFYRKIIVRIFRGDGS